MNKLKLTPKFKEKLARHPDSIGALDYLGSDLSAYVGLPIVAIVGSRKPTPYGKMMTEKLAEGLAKAGVVVVSGLALGVDSLAHSAALKGRGKTIAVLPSGVSSVYPATNRPIANQIVKSGGTLISEYSKNHKPLKIEYLERNRIIAALSDLVIITEAAANSGSLNTANHAKQMGVPIGAVPGNTTSPMSVGANYLLVEGAHAVTDVSDVLKLLEIDHKQVQTSLNLEGDTPVETLILQKISKGFTKGQDLQNETMLSTTEFQSAISMLEIQGRVSSDGQDTWHLT